MSKKGNFICIEGLDGCGKTTHAKLLAAKFSKNYDAIYTAEPSRGRIGAFIREKCLYEKKRLLNVVEALLFAADRVEHVENEIIPAINQGKLVISDRYIFSSLAYQGAAGLSIEWIEQVNKYALKPDLAILIDVAPETVMCRLKPRKSVMENLETQQKVREIYLQFVKEGRLTRINGNKSKVEVSRDLYLIVKKFLSQAT